ncbi:MAG: F0F1 ATP synthase subunit B [Burkholderiaceae bacterium]|nr:F0F1 ATP synthase subunit B [Burkholderiaceae bacterium]MDP4801540.1 F0F1 ATP synthase subunit B [Burkholderiaceae bacterium]
MNLNATLVAQLVVFFVLAWFTMKFVWPPIMKALDERALKIADGLAAADKAKSDMIMAERRAAEEMGKAKDVASEVRSGAEKQANLLIEQARSEATRIVTAARTAAEKEAQSVMQSARDALRDDVAALAIKGATQILRREVDAKTHAEILKNLKNEL